MSIEGIKKDLKRSTLKHGKCSIEVNYNGADELEAPLIVAHHNSHLKISRDENSIVMVLLSTAVAVCGSFVFGTCVGYSAPTQSAIRDDLNLSLPQYSLFGSIVTIGAMVGAIASGRITDFLGRKGAMRTCACICIAGWLALYFATGPLLLDAGRFLTGCGIGLLSYVVPVYIAEISPKTIRGGLATSNQLLIITGVAMSLLIGSVVIWRTLALLGIVPCISLLVGLLFVPESPRWLAKVGNQEQFEGSLRKLRGNEADISLEAAEIMDYIKSLEMLPKASFLDLFDKIYVRSLVVGVGLMVLQQFGGINGIGFYVNETFVQAGLSSGKIGTTIYGLIQVPITLIGALLMDKCGRRPLLLVSALGSFVGCFITATGFWLKSNGVFLGVAPILAVAGVMIYISTFSIGMGGIPWVIMSEIFPINVKGAAGSMVTLVCWLGAWLVTYTFNFMISWSTAGTFYIFAGFNILAVLFIGKIVPETKGKTLEEIQASINS